VVDDAPVVLNAGGSGVFRSRYGARELANIANHIPELEELERATLLADSWAALFSGRVTWNDFHAIAAGLGDQDEPTPWTSVATAVDFINRSLREDQRGSFVDQVRSLFAPQLERLGWNARKGESELAPQLRAIAISALGVVVRDERPRREAVERFGSEVIDGDLARSILRVVASQDRPGDYETFLERYRHAHNPQEEQRYLWGLGDFNDERTTLDAAEKCFSEFRNQDAAIVLGLLSRSIGSGPQVWSYFTGRWDEAVEKFPPSSLSRLGLGIPTFINDDAFAATVEQFHATHSLGGEQRTIDQQLERMRVGLAFGAAMRLQF